MVNSAAVLHADQRVALGGGADELAVVDPLPLDELELPVQARADEGEHQPAVGAVVLQHAGRQRRAVVGAAPDHPVQPDLAGDDRVARVHPPGVRADRALQPARVVAVHERVVALGVGAQLGVVLVRGQGQRRAAGPAPDELGREPLLLGGVRGVLVQVPAEGRRRAGAACGRPRTCRCGPAPPAAGSGAGRRSRPRSPRTNSPAFSGASCGLLPRMSVPSTAGWLMLSLKPNCSRPSGGTCTSSDQIAVTTPGRSRTASCGQRDQGLASGRCPGPARPPPGARPSSPAAPPSARARSRPTSPM